MDPIELAVIPIKYEKILMVMLKNSLTPDPVNYTAVLLVVDMDY
jgi:hypothetical protein